MDECIFCKIAKGEVSADIVYEDDKVVAFTDMNKQAPIHILIIPRAHFESILNVPAGNDIVSHIHVVASKLAMKYGLSDKGFRLVNNCGKDGGQTVHHLHYHMLGGRQLQWPPG